MASIPIKLLDKTHVDTITTNNMDVKQSERRNRGTTCGSSRSGNKHQKLSQSSMWPASAEQMQNVLAT